jgi:hypothetical protein
MICQLKTELASSYLQQNGEKTSNTQELKAKNKNKTDMK